MACRPLHGLGISLCDLSVPYFRRPAIALPLFSILMRLKMKTGVSRNHWRRFSLSDRMGEGLGEGNSHLQIGFLASAVLAVFLAADLGLRFVPLERLAFRPWERLALRREPPAPFAPNQHFQEARAYGDLASLGNMPGRRIYHSQKFSTDALGFRNPPELLASNPPAALLVGSSFSIGGNVSDEETLSAQLNQLSGQKVYNAGGLKPMDLMTIRGLARSLKMSEGCLIYEFLERNKIPKPENLTGQRMQNGLFSRLLNLASLNWVTGQWQAVKPSRMRIFAQRAWKALENDGILPNYSPVVACKPLRNGQSMLFLRDHLQFNQARDVSAAGQYWSWLAAELKKDNLSLLVVLVPEKATIYQPFMVKAPAAPA